MAGETLVTVIGNLTADPELRATAQGPQVCGFTIASTTRTWDRQTGRYEDGDTLFMRCSAWRDLAEHCASTLAKGMRVIARGRLRQRSWQAQDGTSRTMTEMTVDEIGPSLRYANAQVRRTTSGAGHGTGATYGDPNRPAYTGAAPGAVLPAAATDPWAGDGYGQDGTEPEF